jgi:hypothetical protein
MCLVPGDDQHMARCLAIRSMTDDSANAKRGCKKHDCAKARRHSLIFGVRDKSKKQDKLLPELETGSFKIEQKTKETKTRARRAL